MMGRGRTRRIERPEHTLGDFGLTGAQCDHIETFGVPIVPLYVHDAYYLAGVCVDSVMPTDEELRQVRSYIEFVGRRTYGEQILAMPLPADPGHNTVVLVKGGLYKGNPQPTEGWSYRRYTWDTGIFPYRTKVDGTSFRPWSLAEVLDGIEGDISTERSSGVQRAVPRTPWEKWKTAHAEAFPREAVAR